MIIGRTIELAGIFRENNGSLGDALLIISTAVQQFVANTVRQVDGIGADLARLLGPTFLKWEPVRFEITAVGFCLINLIAIGNVGNDRLGKDNDFLQPSR